MLLMVYQWCIHRPVAKKSGRGGGEKSINRTAELLKAFINNNYTGGQIRELGEVPFTFSQIQKARHLRPDANFKYHNN